MRSVALSALALVAAAAHAQDMDSTHYTVTLEQAVATALKNSPVVQGAEASIREAASSTRIAISKKSPRVSANGFLTDGTMQGVVASAPGVDPTMYMPITDETFAGLDLTLMMPLFTGGILESNIKSSTYMQAATLAELREAKAGVALDVNEAYLNALRAYDFEAERSGVKEATELLRVSQQQFAAGVGIEASVSRAEAELAAAQRRFTNAQNTRMKSLIDLRSAMAIDQEVGASPTARLELAKLDTDFDDLVRNAMLRRGSLIALQAKLKSAEQDIRAAQGQFWPQVYGMAMYDASNDPMMRQGATFGLIASIPVFDSGARHADVAKAKATRDRALADLKQEQIRVQGEIRKAWVDVQTATVDANAAQAAQEAARKSYAVALIRFQAGKSTLAEQLDALRAANEAQTDFINSLFEQQFAVARLYREAGFVPGAVGKEFDNGVPFGANPTTKPQLPPVIRPNDQTRPTQPTDSSPGGKA